MGRRRPVAPGLWAWLRVPGSLSVQLAQAFGLFSVQVLTQGRVAALQHESQALRLPPGRALHQRSVCLLGAGQPLLLARSVTGQAAARGAWRALRGLGSRPLARLLFGGRGVRRSRLQWDWRPRQDPQARALARLAPPPLRAATARGVWERRALFQHRGQALLLREFFDPARVAGWPRPRPPRGLQRVGRYRRSE